MMHATQPGKNLDETFDLLEKLIIIANAAAGSNDDHLLIKACPWYIGPGYVVKNYIFMAYFSCFLFMLLLFEL
jgi:hypothetical protein